MISDYQPAVDKHLTEKLGVQVRYYERGMWPKERGHKTGWTLYSPDGPVIEVRHKDWERIQRTLHGRYAPSFWTAAAWHTLSHEYAHAKLGAVPLTPTGRHRMADRLGTKVMPWLMAQAGVPPEKISMYMRILRRSGLGH